MPEATHGADRYVTVDGTRFHYHEWGHPDAPTAVILHGIMGNSREWDTLARGLSPDFRVLSIDQRGHGQTDHTGDYTIGPMVADIVALLGSLGVDRAHLIGHSMGGMVASVTAAQYPGLVHGLVIIDVGPDTVVPGSEVVSGLVAFLEMLAEASYQEPSQAVDEWMAGDPLARRSLMEHYVEHSLIPGPDDRLVWRFDAAGLVQFSNEGVSVAELWGAVDRIESPTLLIRGEHSDMLTGASAAEMMSRFSDGRFVEIPGASHDLGVQKPEAVTEAVRDFLP